MKERHSYKRYIIEARTHELKDSRFSAEFSIEDHDGIGITETVFYVKGTFPTQDSAVKTAIESGKRKIDSGFEAGTQDNKLSRHEIHPGIGITEDVDQLVHDPENAVPASLSDVNQDLSPTVEREQGEARLISCAADRPEIIVDYALKVTTEITGKSATFSRPTLHREYTLHVTPKTGQQIPDGEYDLETPNETLHVRNVGENWNVII